MAVQTGNSGVVKVGTAEVAEVTGWSYDESDVSPLAHQAIGDTTVTHIASGVIDGSGSISCMIDEADTLGQGALTAGATVTLELNPQGTATGTPTLTGSALITQVGKSGAINAILPVSFTYVGALTAGTNL